MQNSVGLEAYQLYIVVSQTGTILSRMLKIITGASYNHASVSLDQSLQTMYSFGRRNPYNPVWGGFVMESPRKGTFKRFSNTDAVVICLSISAAQYRAIMAYLTSMFYEREKYRYNYLGLILAAFHIRHLSKNRYYCSEFVKDLLIRFHVTDEEEFELITQPIHFLKIANGHVIYRGKLRNYSGVSE